VGNYFIKLTNCWTLKTKCRRYESWPSYSEKILIKKKSFFSLTFAGDPFWEWVRTNNTKLLKECFNNSNPRINCNLNKKLINALIIILVVFMSAHAETVIVDAILFIFVTEEKNEMQMITCITLIVQGIVTWMSKCVYLVVLQMVLFMLD
jgi:hypothetical protein